MIGRHCVTPYLDAPVGRNEDVRQRRRKVVSPAGVGAGRRLAVSWHRPNNKDRNRIDLDDLRRAGGIDDGDRLHWRRAETYLAATSMTGRAVPGATVTEPSLTMTTGMALTGRACRYR